jgi:hypothetical protein
MFRTSDLAFFSYVTQNIGYIKAHSKSAPHLMQPNSLLHAPGFGEIPGGDHISEGDSLIGTLSVDCPLCKGITMIVSFVWGQTGWFFQTPAGNGKLLLPTDMTKVGVSRYIETLKAMSVPAERRVIY